MTPEIIRDISQRQEAYDNNPEYYEEERQRVERQLEERQQAEEFEYEQELYIIDKEESESPDHCIPDNDLPF
jgi:hypothetical protein